MAELNNPDNAPFVKKNYRPWNKDLLEQATNASGSKDPGTTRGDPNRSNLNRSSNNFPLNNTINNSSINSNLGVNPNKTMDNQQLQSDLSRKTKEREELIQNINNNRSNIPLSLGGFFQPTNMQLPNSSQNGQKINRLIHDLKHREQEITSITANLKIAEAIEKAEQAEAIRLTEENARISAEKRMKQAIEQVNVAASQLSIAIEKAHLADQAQKEEERARRKVEADLGKCIEQIRILEQKLKNEIEARKTAEDKAQISLNQTIQTELARQEIESIKNKLEQDYKQLLENFHQLELAKNNEEIAKHELQQQFHRYQEINDHDKTILEKTLQNFQFEQTHLIATNDQLNNQIIGLEELIKQQELHVKDLDARILTLQNHQSKLEQIITTEQNLRKLADQKATTALANAAKAELARQEAEKQKKIIDEKAKRAVAHASKTVMKFLDSSTSVSVDQDEEKVLDDNYIDQILK